VSGTQSMMANHRAILATPPEGAPELLPRYACIVYSDYRMPRCVLFIPVQPIYLILLYLNYESVKPEVNRVFQTAHHAVVHLRSDRRLHTDTRQRIGVYVNLMIRRALNLLE
jgi:hypothetical protein